MRSLLRVAAVVLGIAAVALACPGCTCRGCEPSFTWTALLPGRPSETDVRGLTVRLCRNGTCTDTRLDALEVGGNSLTLEGGGSLVIQRAGDGRVELEVLWWDERVSDGDRWAVEVRDASGAIVTGLSERAVDYRDTRTTRRSTTAARRGSRATSSTPVRSTADPRVELYRTVSQGPRPGPRRPRRRNYRRQIRSAPQTSESRQGGIAQLSPRPARGWHLGDAERTSQ